MRKSWITLVGFSAVLGLSGPVGEAARAEPPDWVGGRAAIARLGRLLPAVAAHNALSAAELRRNLVTDRSLRVDVDNQLLYVEPPVMSVDAPDIGATGSG